MGKKVAELNTLSDGKGITDIRFFKGTLYPKTAACHISVNTLYILTKFCTYLGYVKRT